jgi:hypothetical protein
MFLTIFCLLVLINCSPGDIPGIYQHQAYPSITLELTEERKLIMLHTGDIAEYNIVGGEIAVTNLLYGMATGIIEGEKLVFPDAEGCACRIAQGNMEQRITSFHWE